MSFNIAQSDEKRKSFLKIFCFFIVFCAKTQFLIGKGYFLMGFQLQNRIWFLIKRITLATMRLHFGVY